MSGNFQIESSEIYDIRPQQLRDFGLELCRRSRKNAYQSHVAISKEQRGQRYDELKERIRREGFKREFPIVVKLLRENGKKDKILQGHHRLAIATELGLSAVPVRFVY